MDNAEDKHNRDTQPISLNMNQSQRDREVADALFEQDQVPTPRPFAVPRNEVNHEPPQRSTSRALWVVAVLALLVSFASLALNGVLIARLLKTRQFVVDGMDAAIAALDNLEGKGFQYEYHFKQTIPFSGDIPFKQDMVFPFKGDIPINTVVKVPIDAGVLGQFTIDVPINNSFYIDMEVPISIDQAFHVDTEIPLDMVIPIDIQLDDPMIANQLDQIRSWLIELRASF